MMSEPISIPLPDRFDGQPVVAHACSANGLPEHDAVVVCVKRSQLGDVFTVWHAYLGADGEWHLETPHQIANYMTALYIMVERV